MTTTSDVTVWCDGEDCGVWWTYGGRAVSDARQRARLLGWARRGGKDLCPQCAALPTIAAAHAVLEGEKT